jgi:hypothetical protein
MAANCSEKLEHEPRVRVEELALDVHEYAATRWGSMQKQACEIGVREKCFDCW